MLRVLLTDPGRTWRLQPLAGEARVSLGQVYNVKSLLADRERVRTAEDGIILTEPGNLLSDWAHKYKYRRNTIFEYYSLNPLRDVEASIAKISRASGLS